MRKATNIARENLISLGTCLGKLTKTGKFKLHITALDVIAPYSKVRKKAKHIYFVSEMFISKLMGFPSPCDCFHAVYIILYFIQ